MYRLLSGHTSLLAGFAAQNNGCADDKLSGSLFGVFEYQAKAQ